jgi:hypothetical protein
MSGDKKRRYLAANLAWLLMTEEWPVLDVDHVSTDSTDDRWGNLREATVSQNRCNSRKSSRNSTGHKGICLDVKRQQYVVQVQVKGRPRFWRRFDLLEDAIAARAVVAAELHGEFARTA